MAWIAAAAAARSVMNVETFIAPGFEENAYLVWATGSGTAVAIDPGGLAADMLDQLADRGLTLEAVLLTHAHIDHIEGVAPIVRASGAPVYLHPDDEVLYRNAAVQAAQFGMRIEVPPPFDHRLSHGQVLEFAGVTFEVRHVPGHAPGHVLFHVPGAAAAFVGDVVFQGSIGRTDLPGGSYQQLMESIRQQVLTLSDETTLYSGHGPATTVQRERTTNPFLAPDFGGRFA